LWPREEEEMREAWRAYRVTIAIGFRAAPWHATFQLVTGALMALGGPLAVYGAKLLVDAAAGRDLTGGLVAAALIAGTVAGTLVVVFYYCDCVFAVLERSAAFADRRLMELVGGVDGLAHHERPEYLDQVQRIREDRGALAQMVNQTAGVLRATVSLTATAVLLAGVHSALLVLPALGFVSFFLAKRGRDLDVAAQEVTTEPERLRRHLFEVATAPDSGKELRVFGLAGELLHRHHTVSDRVLAERDRAAWRNARLKTLDAVLTATAYIGAVAFVLLLAIDGRATPGDVVLAVGLAAEMGNVVLTAVAYGTNFLHVLKVAGRFAWLEDFARDNARVLDAPVAVPPQLARGIELREVSFRYPGVDRAVVANVSLSLPAGKVVALVGENGAGKTSLIKLLCGFYEADGGDVLVDGTSLRRFALQEWQGRIGTAFQDYAAFEFQARETVGIGDRSRLADDHAVTQALERAGATSVLAALPHGLDTQLGTAWDEGVELSGGQWQRLALGRGLMRTDPLLIVFDEPTAALDAQTEHALFERFAAAARGGQARGAVTLLVSHRFSTVRMADLIVVLHDGGVLEQGSHDELMWFGGLYAELYDLQSKAYR
jgi:ATP-binding cassette, subfamily B, bacterial